MQILSYWNKCQADSRKQLIRKQQGIADGILDNWTQLISIQSTAYYPKSSF